MMFDIARDAFAVLGVWFTLSMLITIAWIIVFGERR